MKCYKCGCENEIEGNFCGYCGSKLYATAHCIRCGREIPEGHELCVDCLPKKISSSGKKKKSTGLMVSVIILITLIFGLLVAVTLFFMGIIPGWESKTSENEDRIEQQKEEPETRYSEPKLNEPEEDLIERVPETPDFEKIESSSEYSYRNQRGQKIIYKAENMMDNNHETAWSPKRDDEKPWIELKADSDQTVNGIKIENGYSKTPDLYHQNKRAKRIRIECDNGFKMTYTLSDMGQQSVEEIKFDDSIETKSIKITVLSMYDGEEVNGIMYGDLCITQIDVY